MKKVAMLTVFALAFALIMGARSTSSVFASSQSTIKLQPVISFTFGVQGGGCYCDGLTLDVDTTSGDFSAHGAQNGCLADPVSGSIVYNVNSGQTGVGVGVAFTGSYQGLYARVTFNPPTWALLDTGGNVINSGPVVYDPNQCLGPMLSTSAAGR